MGLEKYSDKEFEINDGFNFRSTYIMINGGEVFIDHSDIVIYLETIKTEDQLLQLLSLLTGKDQNEFKVQ